MTDKIIKLQDPPKTLYEKIDALDKKNDALIGSLMKNFLPEVIEYALYGFLLYWTEGHYGIERAFLLLGLIIFINFNRQLKRISVTLEGVRINAK
jgi:hypothetical protein